MIKVIILTTLSLLISTPTWANSSGSTVKFYSSKLVKSDSDDGSRILVIESRKKPEKLYPQVVTGFSYTNKNNQDAYKTIQFTKIEEKPKCELLSSEEEQIFEEKPLCVYQARYYVPENTINYWLENFVIDAKHEVKDLQTIRFKRRSYKASGQPHAVDWDWFAPHLNTMSYKLHEKEGQQYLTQKNQWGGSHSFDTDKCTMSYSGHWRALNCHERADYRPRDEQFQMLVYKDEVVLQNSSNQIRPTYSFVINGVTYYQVSDDWSDGDYRSEYTEYIFYQQEDGPWKKQQIYHYYSDGPGC